MTGLVIILDFIRFEVTGFWGDGKTAIADGTHVGLRENSLLGLRHIRNSANVSIYLVSDRWRFFPVPTEMPDAKRRAKGG